MDNSERKATTENKNLSLPSYKTSDLYLSAYLKSKGIIFQGVKKEGGTVIFSFQDNGDIQDLITKYFNDSKVSVLTYKAALRDLRSIIFSYKDQGPVKGNQIG